MTSYLVIKMGAHSAALTRI